MPPREEPLNVSFGPAGLPLPQAQAPSPMGLVGLPSAAPVALPGMGVPRQPAGWLEGLGTLLQGLGSGWAGQPDPAIERRKAEQVAQAMAMQQQQMELHRQQAGRELFDSTIKSIGMLTDNGIAGAPIHGLLQGAMVQYEKLTGQRLPVSPEVLQGLGDNPRYLLALTSNPVIQRRMQQDPELAGALQSLLNRKNFDQVQKIMDRLTLEEGQKAVNASVAARLAQNPGIDLDEARAAATREVADNPNYAIVAEKLPGFQKAPQMGAEAKAKQTARPMARQIADMVGRAVLTPEAGASEIAALGLEPREYLGPALAGAEAAAKKVGEARGTTTPIAPGGPTAGAVTAGQAGAMATQKKVGEAIGEVTPIRPGGPTPQDITITGAGRKTLTEGLARYSPEVNAARAANEFGTKRSQMMAELSPYLQGDKTAQPLASALEQARAGGRPVPPGERQDLSQMENLVGITQTLQRNWPTAKQYFGPARGRAGTVGETMGGISDEEAFVRATVADIANRLIYMMSGKQINESEYVRLQATLPVITNPENVARVRLDRFGANLEAIANERRALQVRPAGEVGRSSAPGKPPPPGWRVK